MSHAFIALARRDLRLSVRRLSEVGLPIAFFAIAAVLFPFGVSPEPAVLRQMAPGVLWVSALLAALMPLPGLFLADHQDGTLEQMSLASMPLWLTGLTRVAVHWLLTGLPLVVVSPLLGLLYGLEFEAIWVLFVALLIGTPVLSLLGGVGAALTLGLRSAGGLLMLLVLPLCIPVLIFGAAAVAAADGGNSPAGHLSLLGAVLLLSLMGSPAAIGAALKIAVESGA